jgi:hypothetical protein
VSKKGSKHLKKINTERSNTIIIYRGRQAPPG